MCSSLTPDLPRCARGVGVVWGLVLCRIVLSGGCVPLENPHHIKKTRKKKNPGNKEFCKLQTLKYLAVSHQLLYLIASLLLNDGSEYICTPNQRRKVWRNLIMMKLFHSLVPSAEDCSRNMNHHKMAGSPLSQGKNLIMDKRQTTKCPHCWVGHLDYDGNNPRMEDSRYSLY